MTLYRKKMGGGWWHWSIMAIPIQKKIGLGCTFSCWKSCRSNGTQLFHGTQAPRRPVCQESGECRLAQPGSFVPTLALATLCVRWGMFLAFFLEENPSCWNRPRHQTIDIFLSPMIFFWRTSQFGGSHVFPRFSWRFLFFWDPQSRWPRETLVLWPVFVFGRLFSYLFKRTLTYP